MNKNLKYIKIKGTLKSRGEYITTPKEYRPYEAVTIVDSEGDEVHFQTLIISKRMDESLDYSKEITFYILRFKNKIKMAGVLYAVDTGTKKIYYPDLAKDLLIDFAMGTSLIMQLNREIGCIVVIIMFFLIVIGLILNNWFELDGTMSVWIGGIAGFMFVFSPLFTKGRRAGISEMESLLTRDGFDLSSTTNSKY